MVDFARQWTDKIGRTKGWFFREHLPGASVSGLSRSNVAFGSSGLLNLEEVLTESGNYGASRNYTFTIAGHKIYGRKKF